MRILSIVARAALSPISFTRRVWNYQFHDFRLILEQSEEVHYFHVWAKAQLFVTRAIVITILLLTLLLLALFGHSAFSQLRYDALKVSKVEAEKKRDEALSAIASLSDSVMPIDGGINTNELLNVVKDYRERMEKMELLVNFSNEELKLASRALEDGLKVSGLAPTVITKLKTRVTNLNSRLTTNTKPSPTAEVEGDLLVNYKKSLDELQQIKQVMMTFPSRTPASRAIVTSKFGVRTHPISHKTLKHQGIDLVPTIDFNVKAVKKGVVEVVQHSSMGYGNMVVILHSHNIRTIYGHLESIFVKSGQQVQESQIIGKIGNTGFSTGKHLHYEVSVDDVKVNPSIITAMAKNVQ
jgi:murein DD-endopeptidase MepM/ murein hydrolase activator NlpD